jgi:hypothetical protein
VRHLRTGEGERGCENRGTDNTGGFLLFLARVRAIHPTHACALLRVRALPEEGQACDC